MKFAPLALFAVLIAAPRAQAKAFFLAGKHDASEVAAEDISLWERFVMESGSMSVETKAPSTPINPAPPTSVPATAQPSPLVAVDTPSPTAFDTSVMPSPTTSAPIPSAPIPTIQPSIRVTLLTSVPTPFDTSVMPSPTTPPPIPSAPVPDVNPAPPTGAPVPSINPAPPTGAPIPGPPIVVINPPPAAAPLPPVPVVVSGPISPPTTVVPVASPPSTGAPVDAPIQVPDKTEIDCFINITGCVSTQECMAAGNICVNELIYYYDIFNDGNSEVTITKADRTYNGMTDSFLFILNKTTLEPEEMVSVGENRGRSCDTDVPSTEVTIGVASYDGVPCSRRRLRN